MTDLTPLFPAVFLIFRLLTGFFGSAFLSVAGGSVTDMFAASKVAKCVCNWSYVMMSSYQEFSPMAVYTM